MPALNSRNVDYVARAIASVLGGLADLRARASRAGRDMKTISVSVFGAGPDEALLDRYAAAGITRAILRLPSTKMAGSQKSQLP